MTETSARPGRRSALCGTRAFVPLSLAPVWAQSTGAYPVVDAFTDPDFHFCDTNAKGYVIGGSRGIARDTVPSARRLSANRLDGPPEDNDVLHVDLNVKFEPMRSLLLLLALMVLFVPRLSYAQDATVNDKLRDLLRQTTTQLRAAQDNAATVQASLDAMTRERDQLQQKLAAAPAAPATPAVSPQQQAALQQAQRALAAARSQNAQLAQSGAHWQKAYADATGHARDKAASDERHAAGLQRANAALTTCKSANAQLITEADGILHLYETPQFNRLLVANHDRVLGFKRVELQNLVQTYEDRLAAQTVVDPAAPPAIVR